MPPCQLFIFKHLRFVIAIGISYTIVPVRFFSVRNSSEFQQLSKKKHSGLKTTVIISRESHMANESIVSERVIWGLSDLGWPQLGRATFLPCISHNLPVVQPGNATMMVAEYK